MELWESIGKSGRDNYYSVSTFGRVWSSKNGLLHPCNMATGYPHLSLNLDGRWKRYLVHRLQAIAFLPNPENKPTVNHKNGIRDDNRIENLEWATSKEQNIHSVEVLGRKGAINNHRRKTVIAYKEGMMAVVETDGVREMGRTLSIPYQGIQACIKYPTRSYFGWKFEVIYDPLWMPKTKKN